MLSKCLLRFWLGLLWIYRLIYRKYFCNIKALVYEHCIVFHLIRFYEFISILFKNLFIFLWLCWVFIVSQAFSNCSEQGLLSSCTARASHHGAFPCCGTLALECTFISCGDRFSFAPWHVGFSWIRDRTHALCIGRQILNQWTTRKARQYFWIYF